MLCLKFEYAGLNGPTALCTANMYDQSPFASTHTLKNTEEFLIIHHLILF